jgi:Tfp pilus assembly protein PilF
MAQDDARTWMTKGIEAFRHARFTEASHFFEQAAKLDPNSVDARISVALIYLQSYVAGAESPENLAFGRSAEENLKKALEIDPRSKIALEYLAQFYFQESFAQRSLTGKIEKLNQAQRLYERVAEAAPNDAEVHCAIGAIAWWKTHPETASARAQLGIESDDSGPLPDEKVRLALRSRIDTSLDDGIKQLTLALQLDANNEDAMEFLGLLLREKAALSSTSQDAKQNITSADDWVTKARAGRAAREEAWRAAHPNSGVETDCPPHTMCFDPEPGSADSPPAQWPPAPVVLIIPPPPPPPPPGPSRAQ